MFGPLYSEGQRSGLTGSKKEIPLPEDDVDAMTIICAVIHHRNDLIPGEMSSSEVLQLSVVADKYDCKVALKHATHHWLDHRNVVGLKEQMELMTAVYLLDQAQAFSAITYTMMMEHTGLYLPFAQDQIDFGVPWELFCKYCNKEYIQNSSINTDDRFTRSKTQLNSQATGLHSIRRVRIQRLLVRFQKQICLQLSGSASWGGIAPVSLP
jgi:hypothetical protein